MNNVYFHIDELSRDAITASALKKEFSKYGVNLVYGNRLYTSRLLESFTNKFDVIIIPKPMFLMGFSDLNSISSKIVVLYTEAIGKFVKKDNPKLALAAFLGSQYMEGDRQYVEKVDAFCLWGIGAKDILEEDASIVSRLHVVGHPRYDRRCMKLPSSNNKKMKKKIGLITRQPLLNDFLNRNPINAIVADSLEEKYTYFNKSTGDAFKDRSISASNEVCVEAIDISIMIKLIVELNDNKHKVYLKVHPREDRNLWVGIIKEYKLKVILADWDMPFSHWLRGIDCVVGPASTSFYDCCVAKVLPICTRKVDASREGHVSISSDENSDLMSYVLHPDSIGEVIRIINNYDGEYTPHEEVVEILHREANYPNSKDSINNIVKVCLTDSVTIPKLNDIKNNLIVYKFSKFLLNFIKKIHFIFKGEVEQGSTFLITKKVESYINSLTD